MKHLQCSVLVLLSLVLPGFGQAPAQPLPPPSDSAAVERGADFRRVSKVTFATNALGVVEAVTNSYTTLSTGIHRWESGRWVDSAPQLIATNKGILGVGAQHTAFFSDTIASREAVSITFPNGKFFKSRILGLAFHSTTTGTNLLIAELKESAPAPQIVGSNQVLYPDAFTDFRVDVRYSYTAAGVEQDLILRESPPRPEAFSMDPEATDLIAITEIMEAPEPKVQERSWHSGRQTLRDQTLDWGGMRMILGRAFDIRKGNRRQGGFVAKQYHVIDGRRVVVERLSFSAAQSQLLQLPPPGSTTLTNAPGSTATNAQIWGASRWFAQGTLPPAPKVSAQASARPIQKTASLSASEQGPGFVMDWYMVGGGEWQFDCLNGPTVISGECHLTSATFTPQAVVAYEPGSSLYIDGPLYWSEPGNCGDGPAVLTSINDGSVGGRIDGRSTGSPSRGEYGPALVVQPEDLATAQSHIVDYYGNPGIIAAGASQPTVSVEAAGPVAAQGATNTATFTISRAEGDWSQPLTVQVRVEGRAGTNNPTATDAAVVIPANQESINVPVEFPAESPSQYLSTVNITLSEDAGGAYTVGELGFAAASAYSASASPSAPVPVPSGVVSWWQAEGNALDALGTNNGTLLGGTAFAAGKVGQGFLFNGINSYVEVPNALSLSLTNELTVEFWVQRQRLDGPDYIVEKGGDWTRSEQHFGVALHYAPGTYCLHFLVAGSWWGAGSVADTNRHHCAVTVRNGDTQPVFYIDGVQWPIVYHSGSGPVRLKATTRPLHIGAQVDPYSGWYYYSSTVIDELALYNRVLSTAEIQSICNAGPGGKFLDVDADGLPDAWELQYFGNLNQSGSGDYDGDGLTNLQEYQLGTNPLDPDTDQDGRSDGQEVAEGTNPLDANSFLPTRLGYWRFNTASWLGEQGQVPLSFTNLQSVLSWNTNAVQVNSANAAWLKYRYIETNGAANLNCRNGTARFWFKPDWTSVGMSGTGPQALATLVALGTNLVSASNGYWGLSISADGGTLQFVTGDGGTTTTNLQYTSLWASNTWHQLVLTYTATNCSLYLDGLPAVTNGVGVQRFPNVGLCRNGFTLGSDLAGGGQARGAFDELETFNFAKSSAQILTDYNAAADTDEDRVVNWQDASPNDPAVGRLTITIDAPSNGAVLH